MIQRLLILFSLIIILMGCKPQPREQAQVQPLPTRVASPTPEYSNIYRAEAVAQAFLHYWELNDFEGMYGLLNFASRDATPFESFVRQYEIAYKEMRFENLNFIIRAQARDGSRIMTFVYDVTFNSSIVGAFDDNNRLLTLTLEDAIQDWRVAWSPANIFNEMGQSASLRLTMFPPQRANIYDRNNVILADMNGRIVSVRVIQNEIPWYDACVENLAAMFNVETQEILRRFGNNAPHWLAEIGLIEPDKFEIWKTTLEHDCDAKFDTRPTRRYIDGDLAPHIIGNVGFPDADEIEAAEAAGFRQDSILGQSGIELSWDETLRGYPGGQLTIVTPDGQPLRLLAESSTQPSQSVYLTIDSDLQRFLQNAFNEVYATGGLTESRGAAGVVLEVNTGAVLAMVSYPTYNANAFTTYPPMGQAAAQQLVQQIQNDPRQPQLNRAAQGRYPTGSTMKAISAVAALDSGAYTFDQKYYSTGVWTRDIPRVDWLPGGHGSLTIAEALTHSCNSCFYEVGYQLNEIDPEMFPAYVKRMGLGVPTGMTDINETSGLIGTPDFKFNRLGIPWTFSDAVDMAIGQGFVEASPLQLARSYASIINGGYLYVPQLVDHVALLDEYSYQMTPKVYAEIDISPDILEYIQGGLCKVTTANYGTAEWIFRNSPLQDLGVCGKTGTAQNPAGLSHAWFVGYAPRENPEVIVAIIVENGGEGSERSAPIVRDVLEYYFFGETSQ